MPVSVHTRSGPKTHGTTGSTSSGITALGFMPRLLLRDGIRERAGAVATGLIDPSATRYRNS